MRRNLFKESFAKSLRKSLNLVNESPADNLEAELGGDLGADDATPADSSFEAAMAAEQDQIDPNKYNQEEKRLQNHLKKRAAENNELLSQWVATIDDFTSFVNDPNREDSIKNIIERAMPGSVLEKIKKSEARRLTRVSTEAAALSQALKSYIGGVSTEVGEV